MSRIANYQVISMLHIIPVAAELATEWVESKQACRRQISTAKSAFLIIKAKGISAVKASLFNSNLH
jgi:hypothetical protein